MRKGRARFFSRIDGEGPVVHGSLRAAPKKFETSVAVLPAPVQVPSQRPLATGKVGKKERRRVRGSDINYEIQSSIAGSISKWIRSGTRPIQFREEKFDRETADLI